MEFDFVKECIALEVSNYMYDDFIKQNNLVDKFESFVKKNYKEYLGKVIKIEESDFSND